MTEADAKHGDGGGGGRRGTPLWVKMLLVGSLALNLLVVGIVAGFALRGEGRAPVAREGGWPYVAALPPRDRLAVGRDIRQALRAGGITREARRSSFEEALALLRRDPFPEERFEALLARQFAAASLVQEAGRRALLAKVAAMRPDERARYADRLAEAMRGGRHGREGRP
jgi:uncharacterized membrane protein